MLCRVKRLFICFKKISNIIVLIFSIFFCIFLSVFSKDVLGNVEESCRICLKTLVPSLFPFMFFSSFLIKSGTSRMVGRLFSPLSQMLFIPKEGISVFLLSMIGGFPVGAKGIKDLFDKGVINFEQAERMLIYCVNSGPAFILGVIGSSFINDVNASLLLLISQILCSFILAIISGLFARFKCRKIEKGCEENSRISIVSAVIGACESSCASVINMCAMVVVFNLFFLFAEKTNLVKFVSYITYLIGCSEKVSKCIPSIIFEVTNACVKISENGKSLPLFSIATSWGGLCVHFQILSILKGTNIKYSKFMLFRVANAILSSSITFLTTNKNHYCKVYNLHTLFSTIKVIAPILVFAYLLHIVCKFKRKVIHKLD